ncbi:MAG: hypothetical protein HKN17_06315, partial [Rhodothermales bacterium]|nr:hypothetical protein [Rhodothermales bacterium]
VTGVDDVPVSFGQRRNRGHIGKTMGVMAGGPFDSKIDVLYSVPMQPSEAAERLRDSFGTPTGEWGLDIRYVLELPDDHGYVVGVSGAAMESKSFDIVGAGADRARSGFACAGIAHAAAYPIELYLAPVDGGTDVRSVTAMYRMKMYFEDAGKWAFMKNMGMPGSIANEISRRVEYSLSQVTGL